MDLRTSVLLCVPLTAKGVDLVVALDVLEIVCIFHSGYFDCRGAFQTILMTLKSEKLSL